jgi:hypothetical protein
VEVSNRCAPNTGLLTRVGAPAAHRGKSRRLARSKMSHTGNDCPIDETDAPYAAAWRGYRLARAIMFVLLGASTGPTDVP